MNYIVGICYFDIANKQIDKIKLIANFNNFTNAKEYVNSFDVISYGLPFIFDKDTEELTVKSDDINIKDKFTEFEKAVLYNPKDDTCICIRDCFIPGDEITDEIKKAANIDNFQKEMMKEMINSLQDNELIRMAYISIKTIYEEEQKDK